MMITQILFPKSVHLHEIGNGYCRANGRLFKNRIVFESDFDRDILELENNV